MAAVLEKVMETAEKVSTHPVGSIMLGIGYTVVSVAPIPGPQAVADIVKKIGESVKQAKVHRVSNELYVAYHRAEASLHMLLGRMPTSGQSLPSSARTIRRTSEDDRRHRSPSA